MPVGKLPYGLQKRVELGRALAMEPELLLLDEPMAGMNLEEKQDMSRFILTVKDTFDTTIALIEHDMGVVMDLSDRVVVLDYGRKIADGTPAEVQRNQARDRRLSRRGALGSVACRRSGQFLEVLIGGLLAGVLYSLVALGFVLIFKASGVFNFAQGAMVLLAGLALVRSLDFLVARGVPMWGADLLGLLFAGVVMAITAWLIERFVLGPLVNQDGLTLFMSTIGATFILEGAAQMIFGSDVYPLRLFPTDAWFLVRRASSPAASWSTSSTCGAA